MKVLSFGRVKAHLEGIWHDSNESLDLTKLHQEILELKKAKLDLNAAKADEDILEKFKKAVPSWSAFISFLSGIAVAGVCVLWGMICLPIVFKMIRNSLWKVGLEPHGIKLLTLP